MRKLIVIVAAIGTFIAFVAGMSGARRLVGSQDTSARRVRKAEPKPGQEIGPSAEVMAEMRRLESERFIYTGTDIVPSETATGTELSIQREIARAFATEDPSPQHRRGVFDWCFSHPKVRLIGWYGGITRTTQADNGWEVELRVSPRLAGIGAVTYTGDYCIETWKYTRDGKLVYQKCTQPENPIRLLFGD